MAELPSSIIARLRDTEKFSAHLDPDLISALVENSLNRAERARIFEHLAYCSQCREASALSLPQGIEPLSPPLTTASWLSLPVLRWGVAVACLLMVGAVVTVYQRSRSRPLEIARSETAAVVLERPAAPPVSAPGEQDKTLRSSSDRLEARSPRPFREKPAPPAPTLSAAPTTQERDILSVDAGTEAMAVRNTPTTPSSELDTRVPGRAKDALEEPRAARDSLMQSKMSPSLLAVEKAQKLVPRWTLSSDGTLERSFDSGNTWEVVPLPSQARFHVLSAHGMDIWVGGSGGALYHSVDAGKNWVQVQPVAGGQSLTEDVIGMEFVDDDHGVLTTSTNQRWATEDCGQSWQRK